MNDAQFLNCFSFLRYQYTKNYSYTGYNKNSGAPAHYIVRLVKGSARIKSRTNTIAISAGDIFYIPKGLKYQSFWYVDTESQIVFESFGFQNFPLPDGHNYTLQKVDCDPESEQLLLSISERMSVNCSTVGKLYQFLGAVLPQMVQGTKHYHNLAEIALDYMHNNAEYRISDVAEYCKVSEVTLYSIFKKAYNKTPVEMKQMIACEKASELLITTNLSVEEISSMLNFSSSSYFRKVFKKCTGKSPLQVRKTSKYQL